MSWVDDEVFCVWSQILPPWELCLNALVKDLISWRLESFLRVRESSWYRTESISKGFLLLSKFGYQLDVYTSKETGLAVVKLQILEKASPKRFPSLHHWVQLRRTVQLNHCTEDAAVTSPPEDVHSIGCRAPHGSVASARRRRRSTRGQLLPAIRLQRRNLWTFWSQRETHVLIILVASSTCIQNIRIC